MDYILQLRQYIGHRPILMVGAAILVVDAENRLLLMKRSDSGCWGPPGGATEPGERVEEAAKRETLEETGLEIGAMALFGVFSGPELYYKYPNDDEVYNVTIVYLSRDWRGAVEINHEHTEFRWFAAAGIPENISPPIIPVIEQFKRVFSPDGGATRDNHPRGFTLTGPLLGQSGDCEQVLRALPDWFGLEAAIQNYAAAIPALPTFLAKAGGQAVGFLSLKQHNPCSAEIYVMGVLPAFHHQGIGRALVEKAEGYAKARQIEYLQVKTLGPSNDDAHYAQTRAFYTAMGFRPLEEFTQIWDENNPCLVMVKKI